jgi:hypothetical protein
MRFPFLRCPHRRFGSLCLLLYVALAWAVRLDMRLGEQIASLVYPLDTFSMYSRMPGTQESLLLVRDRQGTVHRVTDFRSFDCDEAVNGAGAPCSDRRGIPYHYEDLARYVDAHAGPGQLEVDLVTRTWELRRWAPPVLASDCVLAHCRVAR